MHKESFEKHLKGLFNEYISNICLDDLGLVDASEHGLLYGGKRIRPEIMIQTFNICVADPKQAHKKMVYDFGAALEAIHSFSLIHDDLPCIDNDLLRRGQPTVHSKFGEATAVLAGDALLNMAYQIMINSTIRNPEHQSKALRAMAYISSATGFSGMILGEACDIANARGQETLSIENIGIINKYKTGALIRAAICTGAILAGKKDIEFFEKIAMLIGELFQITDDILDITGTSKKMGKNIKNDQSNNLSTYPSILGVEGARIEARRIDSEIKSLDDGYYSHLATRILNRDK